MRAMRGQEAFSLIEILMVVAVIGILGAIVLRVQDGVRERAAISRAEGELAVLAAALERYHARFGEYPMEGGGREPEAVLYGALLGALSPDGREISLASRGGALVDLGSLTVGVASSGEVAEELAAEQSGSRVVSPDRDWSQHVFLDPWNNPYIYRYRGAGGGGAWQRRGYLLLSLGPSAVGAAESGTRESPAIPASGLLSSNYLEGPHTYDNILAHP